MTSFGFILPLFGKIIILDKMLKVLIKYLTIFLIYFGNFYAIGQTLIAVNGQILFQYSCHLVTLVVCPYLTSVGKTLQYC